MHVKLMRILVIFGIWCCYQILTTNNQAAMIDENQHNNEPVEKSHREKRHVMQTTANMDLNDDSKLLFSSTKKPGGFVNVKTANGPLILLLSIQDVQVVKGNEIIRLKKDRTRRIRRSMYSHFSMNCTSQLLSCKDRCMDQRDAGGTQQIRCSCDPYCDYFKDCCADYVQYCLKKRSWNTTKTAMKEPDEQWTCRSDIWMIASCPRNWTNQDVNQSCISTRSMTADNYKDVLPVVTADYKTYANRLCAQCHRQNLRTTVDLYKLEFVCSVAPPSKAKVKEKEKFLFEFCRSTLSYQLGNHKQRRYCHHSKSTCSDHTVSEELKNNCVFGNYGLVDNLHKLTFKNVHCGKCNGISPDLLQCGPGIGIEEKTNHPKPFSIIMNIENGMISKKDASQTLSCPKGKVYDVYLETCRQGNQFAPVKSKRINYEVALWMKAQGSFKPNVYLYHSWDFVDSFTKAIMVNSTTVTSVLVTLLDPDQHIYRVEFDLDITNSTQSSSNTTSTRQDIFSVFYTANPFKLIISSHVFVIMKITFKPSTCSEAMTYSPYDYRVLPGSTASVYINTTGEVLGVRDYFPTNLTMVNGRQVPVGDIVVCRPILLVNCSGMFIFLQKHEFVICPNRSVLYNASGHLYEYGTYMWNNGTIMICINFTATYRQLRSQSNNDDKKLTILTGIGFSLSVLCLIFVLATYSLFADLRTVPGINLMNLCSALLVAQLLWLVGSGLTFSRLGCMIIAIVLHYSFLASFWWMSIIAFNTWIAFSGKARTSSNRCNKEQKRKRIRHSMAMGWLPLIMYVAICVALDRSGIVAIGYGGEKGCWINNSRANLYFFATPVALSISWNAVFFVMIVKEIKKAIDQSQMAASQHQARKDSTVYARIAVLMGFTWVFGFIAPFTSYYLMYPFVILNTLQGLYIAVAFGCTRRVRAMYRNIGNKMKKNTTSNKRSQTSETKI